MAKKAKGKGKAKAKKEKQPEIPEEWVGMSAEELKALVAELESQLAISRKNRNRAQVEHDSIQSYYDVTREEIRFLEMKIEKTDLDIENAEDDNATELRIYEQKANFIKYCHDNRLNEVFDDNEKQKEGLRQDQDEQVQSIESAKKDMRVALTETEEQQTDEIKNLQQEGEMDLERLKEKLDADVKLFEQKCDEQHLQLQRELDKRGAAQLKMINSRKESHLNDLVESHQKRCKEMRAFFEGVERQQQIDIEDLEAEIRRLKKAATQNELNSNHLKESNERCGRELKTCSEKVSALQSKTKDKEKNATSLRTTNARLSATRKAIREAMVKYKELQQKFDMVEEERDGLREGIEYATAMACRHDMEKKNLLDSKLREQNEQNAVLEQHLKHIVSSAGLEGKKSEVLQSNLNEFIKQNSEELEKLNLSIAKATASYNKALKTFRLELVRCGVSIDELESLDVLGEIQNTEAV